MAKHKVERDPWLFAERIKKPARSNLVLGLDLGTNCGYAFAHMLDGQRLDPEKLALSLGQFDLSAGQYDSGAIRFVRLRQFLSVLEPDLIAFEDVKYTPAETPTRFNARAIVARAATACEWFGGLKATVAAWAEENGVPCTSFPIGTIKKRATGKGNANKGDMIVACNELFGSDMDSKDYESAGYDNIADAAFVCLLALEHYSTGLPRQAPEAPREQEEQGQEAQDEGHLRHPDGEDAGADGSLQGEPPAEQLAAQAEPEPPPRAEVTSETPRKKRARKPSLGRMQIPESEIP